MITRLYLLLLILATLCMYTACSDTGNTSNSDQVQDIAQTDLSGARVISSISDLPECVNDIDGQLYYVQTEGTFYYCNGQNYASIDLIGAAGPDGTNGYSSLISVSDNPSECGTIGGKKLSLGVDNGDGSGTVADGVLQSGEVDATTYVCNGADGSGHNSLINISTEPAGGNCATGGQKVVYGLDNGDGAGTANNGVLESGEVDSTVYVCNGADGSNGATGASGYNTLLQITTESAGANCANGGKKIESGLDNGDGGGTVNDGILQTGEIDGPASYVCNGTDGSSGGSSLTARNAAVAPGSALTLTHNLASDGVNFIGQFVKGGYVYNYGDYADQFTTYRFTSATEYDTADIREITTCALANGNFAIAYMDYTASRGKYAVYGPTGGVVKAPVEFYGSNIVTLGAAALNNGGFIIAYQDYTTNVGYFKIYDASGSESVSQTQFDASLLSGVSRRIDVAPLKNGNFVITFQDSTGSDAEFVIYDASGSSVKSKTQISTKANTFISLAPMNNGYFVIAYNDGSVGSGYFTVYDQNGNVKVAETNFHGYTVNYLTVAALPNNTFTVSYRDSNNSNYGTFQIYDATGSPVTAKTVFRIGTILDHAVVALDAEHIMFVYSNDYWIYTTSGVQVASGEYISSADKVYRHAISVLASGNCVLSYNESVSADGNFLFGNKGYLVLEKVDTNTARLWNYTGETLELIITAVQ